MQLIINLNKHCIETEIKKEYEASIKRYFDKKLSNDEKALIEGQIEALLFLLEHADFSFLRSHYPELNGNNGLRIILSIPKTFSETKIIFNRTRINVEWKESKPS